jgi:hypothetical protein
MKNVTRPRTILNILGLATMISLMAPQVQSQTLMTNLTLDSVVTLKPSPHDIWEEGAGEGFLSSVYTISVENGVAFGDLVKHMPPRPSVDAIIALLEL